MTRGPMRTTTALLLLALALPAACGDDGGDSSDGPPAAVDGGPDAAPGADGAPATTIGELQLVETRAPWGASGVLDGVFVAEGLPRWHTEVATGGTCRLLRFQAAFCDPPCSGFCREGNVCLPFPTFTDAGRLTVTGAKAPITADPGPYGFVGHGYGASLPADLFDDGDLLTARFAGGPLPAFEVAARGVAPLVVTLANDELPLPNGADVTFRWTAAPAGADTRVRLTLNANNAGGHGSPYAAILECDAPDTGSLVIPRAMIEAFPATYRWEVCAGSDCPLSSATRYRRGAADLAAGRVDFLAGARVSFWIIHEVP